MSTDWYYPEPPKPRPRTRPTKRRTTLERNETCRRKDNACAENASELRDAIGHDPLGHRIAKLLVRQGVTTVEQLMAMPPGINGFNGLNGISDGALQRLRDRGILQAGPGLRVLLHLPAVSQLCLSAGETDTLQQLIEQARTNEWVICGTLFATPEFKSNPVGEAVRREADAVLSWGADGKSHTLVYTDELAE